MKTVTKNVTVVAMSVLVVVATTFLLVSCGGSGPEPVKADCYDVDGKVYRVGKDVTPTQTQPVDPAKGISFAKYLGKC